MRKEGGKKHTRYMGTGLLDTTPLTILARLDVVELFDHICPILVLHIEQLGDWAITIG